MDISTELVLFLLRAGQQHPGVRVIKGLPEDAKVIGASFTGEFEDTGVPKVTLVLSSESFDEVAEGTHVSSFPRIDVLLENVT